MTPEEYLYHRLNAAQGPKYGPKDVGALEFADAVELVKLAQRALDVMPDGYPGPVTVAALRKRNAPKAPGTDIEINAAGWAISGGVLTEPFHASWSGGAMVPKAIVVHTTATAPGTAKALHAQRKTPFGTDPDIHAGSWHFTIETDGTIRQGVSCQVAAWHGGSITARPLPVGYANYNAIGIELVSADDKGFPVAQIAAAERLWRALVRRYGIPAGLSMIPHGGFDPVRRVDPGSEWMGEPAPFKRAMKFAGPVGGHARRVWEYAHR